MILVGVIETAETIGTRTIRIDLTRTSVQTEHSWDPEHRSAIPGTEEQPRSAAPDVRETAESGR